jgi:hypothetical protein
MLHVACASRFKDCATKDKRCWVCRFDRREADCCRHSTRNCRQSVRTEGCHGQGVQTQLLIARSTVVDHLKQHQTSGRYQHVMCNRSVLRARSAKLKCTVRVKFSVWPFIVLRNCHRGNLVPEVCCPMWGKDTLIREHVLLSYFRGLNLRAGVARGSHL